MSPCSGCRITPSSLPSPPSPALPCRPGVAAFWHWDRLSSLYEVFEREGVPAPSLQRGSLQDNVCGLPLQYSSHLHKPLLLEGRRGTSGAALTHCKAPQRENKAKPRATESKRCLQRALQPGRFVWAGVWETLCTEQLFSSTSSTHVRASGCWSQRTAIGKEEPEQSLFIPPPALFATFD